MHNTKDLQREGKGRANGLGKGGYTRSSTTHREREREGGKKLVRLAVGRGWGRGRVEEKGDRVGRKYTAHKIFVRLILIIV